MNHLTNNRIISDTYYVVQAVLLSWWK